MESIPLLYQIIFIVVIYTIAISLIAYLICKRRGRRKTAELNERDKVKLETQGLGKSQTEVVKQSQKPFQGAEKKDLSQEKQVKDKKQKYIRYTPSGYINIEEDRYKKKSKWL